LHELLPHVNLMALLLNPNNLAANSQLIEAERAAQA
jgi:hypothetical protein